jgi:hypothetical protein
MAAASGRVDIYSGVAQSHGKLRATASPWADPAHISNTDPVRPVRFVWLWQSEHKSVQIVTTMHGRRARRVADGAEGEDGTAYGRVAPVPPAQPSVRPGA